MGLGLVKVEAGWSFGQSAIPSPYSHSSNLNEATMFMLIRPPDRYKVHTQGEGGPRHPVWNWIGILFVLGALWLISALVGCSSSQKEYIVDYAQGKDATAKGSHDRPCRTEVHCRMLADRDGVRSYWMVHQ
ncbi:MAG: hypothetical protein OJF50_000718 [Nitrospira sp.]|nr:hypothetical protein [Nitrospira sp.]